MAKFTDILAKGTKAVCGKLYNSFKEDTAKLMIFASVTGVVLAGLSNTLGIAINKKTTKEEKQFLLPMEITDSIMNLATFYASSAGAKKFAENLVDKGVIDLSHAKTPYARQGVTILATVLGSVLASNVLTPIIRNTAGAKIQQFLKKRAGLDDTKHLENTVSRPLPNNTVKIPQSINSYRTSVRKSNLTI